MSEAIMRAWATHAISCFRRKEYDEAALAISYLQKWESTHGLSRRVLVALDRLQRAALRRTR
jgi:hypothetical protein